MGGRIIRYVVNTSLICAASALGWNVLLDDRARHSAERAARETARLASFAITTYMENSTIDDSAKATARNQEWVRKQWEQAGY